MGQKELFTPMIRQRKSGYKKISLIRYESSTNPCWDIPKRLRSCTKKANSCQALQRQGSFHMALTKAFCASDFKLSFLRTTPYKYSRYPSKSSVSFIFCRSERNSFRYSKLDRLLAIIMSVWASNRLFSPAKNLE